MLHSSTLSNTDLWAKHMWTFGHFREHKPTVFFLQSWGCGVDLSHFHLLLCPIIKEIKNHPNETATLCFLMSHLCKCSTASPLSLFTCADLVNCGISDRTGRQHESILPISSLVNTASPGDPPANFTDMDALKSAGRAIIRSPSVAKQSWTAGRHRSKKQL